jgi:hypothetical protein
MENGSIRSTENNISPQNIRLEDLFLAIPQKERVKISTEDKNKIEENLQHIHPEDLFRIQKILSNLKETEENLISTTENKTKENIRNILNESENIHTAESQISNKKFYNDTDNRNIREWKKNFSALQKEINILQNKETIQHPEPSWSGKSLQSIIENIKNTPDRDEKQKMIRKTREIITYARISGAEIVRLYENSYQYCQKTGQPETNIFETKSAQRAEEIKETLPREYQEIMETKKQNFLQYLQKRQEEYEHMSNEELFEKYTEGLPKKDFKIVKNMYSTQFENLKNEDFTRANFGSLVDLFEEEMTDIEKEINKNNKLKSKKQKRKAFQNKIKDDEYLNNFIHTKKGNIGGVFNDETGAIFLRKTKNKSNKERISIHENEHAKHKYTNPFPKENMIFTEKIEEEINKATESNIGHLTNKAINTIFKNALEHVKNEFLAYTKDGSNPIHVKAFLLDENLQSQNPGYDYVEPAIATLSETALEYDYFKNANQETENIWDEELELCALEYNNIIQNMARILDQNEIDILRNTPIREWWKFDKTGHLSAEDFQFNTQVFL